jgi:DamX protein
MRPQWFCDAAPNGKDWNCIESATPESRATPVQRPAPAVAQAPTVAPAPVEPPEPPVVSVPPTSTDGAIVKPIPAPSPPPARGAIPLVDLPSDYYVVQLLALSSKEALQTLATELKLPNLSAAVIESDGQLFYVLLLGAYPDRAAAERAIAERPEALRSFEPWIRSLGSLKEGMWRAQSSTASVSSTR